MWSTRSTKPRRKINLGTIQRFEKLWEICNITVDHRILGVPPSAVEQQNTTRENKVKRLIEMFENHKHKCVWLLPHICLRTHIVHLIRTQLFRSKANSLFLYFSFRNVSLIAFKDLGVYGLRVELYGRTSGGGQVHGLKVP